ncbi:MAG: membrane metalloprotease [Flavobacteriaceae bacterium]|nr:membrane metalloprotease [Flavobacteriaceae bacterium]
MKKILILLALGLVFFGSCSKEDTSSIDNQAVDKSQNLKATGTSAHDLLSDTQFKSLVIELVYVEGFAPTQTTLNNLKSFLSARLYKPGGITVQTKSIPSPGQSPYSMEEIAAIENATRTEYNNADQIAVWAFFTDGESANNTSSGVVLGIAYRNTSFVIFEETIHGYSDNAFEPDRDVLESTVTEHEFGHLLGLVNLGTDLQSDHEDADHAKHCDNQSCLMYWAAETGKAIDNITSGGTIPQLDANCIADLQANGGK